MEKIEVSLTLSTTISRNRQKSEGLTAESRQILTTVLIVRGEHAGTEVDGRTQICEILADMRESRLSA